MKYKLKTKNIDKIQKIYIDTYWYGYHDRYCYLYDRGYKYLINNLNLFFDIGVDKKSTTISNRWVFAKQTLKSKYLKIKNCYIDNGCYLTLAFSIELFKCVNKVEELE